MRAVSLKILGRSPENLASFYSVHMFICEILLTSHSLLVEMFHLGDNGVIHWSIPYNTNIKNIKQRVHHVTNLGQDTNSNSDEQCLLTTNNFSITEKLGTITGSNAW